MTRALALIVAIFRPVRVRIMRWDDRRTLLQLADGDLIRRRVQACRPCPADLYLRIDRNEIPVVIRAKTPTLLMRQAA